MNPKRINTGILAAAVAITLLLPRHALAANPTPTPTLSPNDYITVPLEDTVPLPPVDTTDAGTHEKVEITITPKPGATGEAAKTVTDTIYKDIGELSHGGQTDIKSVKFTDHKVLLGLLSLGNAALLPFFFTDNALIHYPEPNQQRWMTKVRECADAPEGHPEYPPHQETVSESPVLFEKDPEITNLWTQGNLLAAINTMYQLVQDPALNQINLWIKPALPPSAAPPCGQSSTGTQTTVNKPVKVVQGWGLLEWIKYLSIKFIGSEQESSKGTAAINGHTPYAALYSQLIGKKDGSTISYTADKNEKLDVAGAGGFADSIKVLGLEPKVVDIHALNPEQVTLSKKSRDIKIIGQEDYNLKIGKDITVCAYMPLKDPATASVWDTYGPADTECSMAQPTETGMCDLSQTKIDAIKNDNMYMNSGGSGGAGSVGYSIPFKNTGCTIDSAAAEKIAEFAASWSQVADKTFAKNNFMSSWEGVQNVAIAQGWNPAFVMSIWIEESAAGGVKTQQMGCLYGWTKDLKPVAFDKTTSACEQAYCLTSHKNQQSFGQFMCSYDTVGCADNKAFKEGSWNFANAVKLSYSKILQLSSLGGNGSCGISK